MSATESRVPVARDSPAQEFVFPAGSSGHIQNAAFRAAAVHSHQTFVVDGGRLVFQQAIVLVQGAPNVQGFHVFRQSNTFYYLTGVESPHAYVLLDGTSRTTTFIDRPNDHDEQA